MKAKIYFIMAFLAFAGIAFAQETVVTKISLTESVVEQIRVGMHRDEVLGLLGPADEVVNNEGGSLEWIYRSVHGSAKSKNLLQTERIVLAKLLSVSITSDGIVSNVFYDEIDQRRS